MTADSTVVDTSEDAATNTIPLLHGADPLDPFDNMSDAIPLLDGRTQLPEQLNTGWRLKVQQLNVFGFVKTLVDQENDET